MSRVDDLKRVRSEITRLRQARDTSVRNLERHTREMRAGFRRAHARMSASTRVQLTGFVSGLKRNASLKQANFRRAHTEMRAQTKAERAEFVSRLKSTVAALQKSFIGENLAAHRAWVGKRA